MYIFYNLELKNIYIYIYYLYIVRTSFFYLIKITGNNDC